MILSGAAAVFIATGDLEHGTGEAQRGAKSLGVPVNASPTGRRSATSSCRRSSIAAMSWWRSRPAARSSPTLAATLARPHRGVAARAHRQPGQARVRTFRAQVNALIVDPPAAAPSGAPADETGRTPWPWPATMPPPAAPRWAKLDDARRQAGAGAASPTIVGAGPGESRPSRP